HYSRTRWYKKSVMTVTNVPMMNPDIVTGISMMLLFVFVGTILKISGVLGFATMLLAHITFELPYVILNILPRFKSMDRYLTEAACDLGCTPVQAFFKVTLPYIKSEILAAFIMAFTLSLDDFVISYFVSGPQFQTLPIRIYSMTKKRVTPDMYALSAIIFVTVLLLLILTNVAQDSDKRKKRKAVTATAGNALPKIVIAIFVVMLMVSVLVVPACATSLDEYKIDKAYYANNPYKGTTLNVYNWGEYISDGAEDTLDVNAYFEELTGIKVNYTNFDSNEDMYAKIKSGGANYDVIIPSDYMIERMIEEELLLKLDMKNIPNFKYVDDKYKGLYFDVSNEYTVAYNVGYVGIVYNTKMVEEEPDSWSVLWDSRYAGQILMFNNPRDGFAIAQSLLGQDYNSTNPSDWAMAYDKLLEQKSVVRSYVMDEVFNIMESGAAAVAPYYIGDIVTMMDNNEDLAVAYPKEGANVFVDSMCIPITAQNKGAAELYINFMQEPEVALANAEYICYATPNVIVRDLDEYSLQGDEIIYPDDSLVENYQYFHNMPSEVQSLMSNYWSDLKVDGNSNVSTYIGLGVFVVLFSAYGVYRVVKRKRREQYYD
ncbi:MAG: extracellular solute-binding protein, partial [Clostridia bacterium]|nr:extracellular solute-binding protein [Clostridia bacterium]